MNNKQIADLIAQEMKKVFIEEGAHDASTDIRVHIDDDVGGKVGITLTFLLTNEEFGNIKEALGYTDAPSSQE